MKVAIMQPYFLPYIGYFQLINAVDTFVVYDQIEYTKKGWINRNRILVNNRATYISLPLKKDSDYCRVDQRYLSSDFEPVKILNQIKGAYFKAPNFTSVYPLCEEVLKFNDKSLFNYIFNSIKVICKFLEIRKKVVIFSELGVDYNLKGEEKIIRICQKLGANVYINPIGGASLYSKKRFSEFNIDLAFLRNIQVPYPQFCPVFESSLSIIDVLMFNSKERVIDMISNDFEVV